MTSLRQIEANRRNSQLSTGPVTEEGKRKSRRNAVRHGLTAETVIGALEDADDYTAFELAVTADYEPETAVERELVLRLASLLWRLRRASMIESGLFEIQAQHLSRLGRQQASESDALTRSFVRLTHLRTYPLDRLSRYEAGLWRQTRQILSTMRGGNGPSKAIRRRFEVAASGLSLSFVVDLIKSPDKPRVSRLCFVFLFKSRRETKNGAWNEIKDDRNRTAAKARRLSTGDELPPRCADFLVLYWERLRGQPLRVGPGPWALF